MGETEENNMQSFGTEEYGNKDGFKVICCQCRKEARLVPTHHYKDGEYKHSGKDHIGIEMCLWQ